MTTEEYLIKRILDLEQENIRLKKKINALDDFMQRQGIYRTCSEHTYPELDEVQDNV